MTPTIAPRPATNVLHLLALVANTRQLYADAPDRAPYLDAIEAARAGLLAFGLEPRDLAHLALDDEAAFSRHA